METMTGPAIEEQILGEPPIDEQIRNRLGPPTDFPPEPPDEPQDLPDMEEVERVPFVITLELLSTDLSSVEAVKKAHELLQSADAKGLELVAFNVADYFLAQAQDAEPVERG